MWFLLGAFDFLGVCGWLIGGQMVVDCVAKMVCGTTFFEGPKFCSF